MSKKLKNFMLRHIKKLGIKKNNCVLVYSDLSKFGFNNNSFPKIALSSLKIILGKNGSIVMPFYLLNNKRNYVYDEKKFVLSEKIGLLTKLFCKEKNLIRSNSLIHNHIGIGPAAKILSKSSENISIGKNSDFYLLKKYNFKLLLLGCDPMQGATYLHHMESLHGVPYRKWIKLKKIKLVNNQKKLVLVKYYAKKNNKYSSNFNNFFASIAKKSALKVQKVKYGKSFCISLKNLDKITSSFLKKNKYALVRKNN